MKILYSEKCLNYSQPGHPESPERVSETRKHLEGRHEFVEPVAASEEDILRAHTGGLLEQVRTERFYDGDSPAYPNLFSFATLSAGGAIAAAEAALEGEQAFSLMRPPGHHAGKNFLGGFCYLNNMAIAIAKALRSVGRAAIIDFDCHHGNGTQDIFMKDERVLYVSLHQSPLYPGTGYKSELNCRNFPVEAGTDEEGYLTIFRQGLAEVVEFGPDIIGVSAGFDTFRGDRITNLGLEIDSFEKLGSLINEMGKPVFSVLEGGYAREMPHCVDSYLKGLTSRVKS